MPKGFGYVQDSSDEEQTQTFHKKRDKNSEIYGIFADGLQSDSDEDKARKPKTVKKAIFLNFQKSSVILHDVNKVVTVSIPEKKQKKDKKVTFEDIQDKKSSDEEQEQITQTVKRRVQEFSEKQSENKNLKKVKLNVPVSSEQIREQTMEESYGVGLKIMKQMGYTVDRGIGKERQGRTEPIQAMEKKQFSSNYQLKVKNIGVKQKQVIKEKISEKIEEEEVVVVRRWQGNRQSSHHKQHIEIQSDEKQETKIIDMTHTQPKIVYSYSTAKPTSPLQLFLNALQKKLQVQKQVNQKINQKKTFIEQQNINLEHEKQEIKKQIEINNQKKQVLKHYLEAIKQTQNSQCLNRTLELTNICYKSSQKYFLDYKMNELFLFQIFKHLKQISVSDVRPEMLKSIKMVINMQYPSFTENENDNFEQFAHSKETKADKVFESIINQVFQSKIVQINTNIELILQFFDINKQHLPLNFCSNISEMQIMPHLKCKIENFSFKELLHTNLFPWFPHLLEHQTEWLLDCVQKKFIQCLPQQNITDQHILQIIEPFQSLFSEQQWRMLLVRTVVPKLTFLVQKVEVDPGNQDVQLLEKVFTWNQLLSDEFLEIVYLRLVAKIKHILDQWINQKGHKQEICEWFQGWIGFLGTKIVEVKNISAQMSMMQIQIEQY